MTTNEILGLTFTLIDIAQVIAIVAGLFLLLTQEWLA